MCFISRCKCTKCVVFNFFIFHHFSFTYLLPVAFNLCHLFFLFQGYLEPWRADPECLLAQHLQHLFSNLEEIYRFNRWVLVSTSNPFNAYIQLMKVLLFNSTGRNFYQTGYFTPFRGIIMQIYVFAMIIIVQRKITQWRSKQMLL